MKERNIPRFEQRRLGIDDTFKFHCTMCGKCCINREDILLPPRDLYAMAKELNLTPKEFFDKYCEVYIGSDTRIPVVRLKPVGSVKRCPLLKDRKCSVHQAKPTVCALFPIGRFMLSEKFEGKLTNQKTGYFFVNPGCGDDSETQTVRDWLNAFGIPLEDPFFKVWQDALINLSMEMQRIEKSIAVNRNCNQNSGIRCEKCTWLVCEKNNLCAGITCHLYSKFIHGRVPWKAEYDQAVLF